MADLEALLAALPQLEAERARRARRRFFGYYPEDGPLSRHQYPKHMEFFRAGAVHNSRLLMAGNRCGKTFAGCYETTVHATGMYPDWWEGFRFGPEGPGMLWICGKTGKTTRNILQKELLGAPNAIGTGMIPGDLIYDKKAKAGVADAYELVYVKNQAGVIQTIEFKSYDQGRDAYEGGKPRVIHQDEEPPAEVAYECRARLIKTSPSDPGGISYLTFTPLDGWTEIIDDFAQTAVNKQVLSFTQHDTVNK